ncbi:uncharacterized protein LOC130727330 [Lotus japonicus]|uniref:uncharacterized protein LOC130727330 n=1 Tax=Lotus japonicus TaxID=34305 RepID=UPI00258AEA60|nr:uncharacterized protein LOC130727330 [Lotus japonicus]
MVSPDRMAKAIATMIEAMMNQAAEDAYRHAEEAARKQPQLLSEVSKYHHNGLDRVGTGGPVRSGFQEYQLWKPYQHHEGRDPIPGSRKSTTATIGQEAVSCYRCGKLGHYAFQCSVAETKCWKCRQRGHLVVNCRTFQAGPSDNKMKGKFPAIAKGARKQVSCFRYGEPGHYANACPDARPKCYNCNKMGHTAGRCRAPKAEPTVNTARGKRSAAKARVYTMDGERAEGFVRGGRKNDGNLLTILSHSSIICSITRVACAIPLSYLCGLSFDLIVITPINTLFDCARV